MRLPCSSRSHEKGNSMLWQIYARYPNAEEDWAAECYASGMIAVGWSHVGDLRAFESPEEIGAALVAGDPDYYRGMSRRISANAHTLWRFAHEVPLKALVICPDDRKKCYYFGTVRSAYFYEEDEEKAEHCPFLNRREMKWQGAISRAEAAAIWGPGHVGSVLTVARVLTGEAEFRRLIGQKARRKPRRVSGHRSKPDSNWGRAAELRAMEWLSGQGATPKDVAHLNLGWDIECGGRKYEVKGRRAPATTIRLTQNEYGQARRHRGNYLMLVFTAQTPEELAKAQPEVIPDPARTREWKVRTVKEYMLQE